MTLNRNIIIETKQLLEIKSYFFHFTLRLTECWSLSQLALVECWETAWKSHWLVDQRTSAETHRQTRTLMFTPTWKFSGAAATNWHVLAPWEEAEYS